MSPPAVAARDWESVFYFGWKRHGRHVEGYASEFIGTAFMVFCVVGVVGLMFAPRPPIIAILPPICGSAAIEERRSRKDAETAKHLF